jgi:hypothetical protein
MRSKSKWTRLVPLILVILAATAAISAQSQTRSDSLGSKKTIFIRGNQKMQEYVLQHLGSSNRFEIVSDVSRADLILEVSYDYGHVVDVPYGRRLAGGKPDYRKPDDNRRRTYSEQRTTVTVFESTGGIAGDIQWRRSKTTTSSSPTSTRVQIKDWDGIASETIPAPAVGPKKDILPSLIKRFARDLEKAG